jgi:hypothetical protein
MKAPLELSTGRQKHQSIDQLIPILYIHVGFEEDIKIDTMGLSI